MPTDYGVATPLPTMKILTDLARYLDGLGSVGFSVDLSRADFAVT